jgi:hypothetical protein
MLESRSVVATLSGETIEVSATRGCMWGGSSVTPDIESGCGRGSLEAQWEWLLLSRIYRCYWNPN